MIQAPLPLPIGASSINIGSTNATGATLPAIAVVADIATAIAAAGLTIFMVPPKNLNFRSKNNKRGASF